jgi:hypothetical protein
MELKSNSEMLGKKDVPWIVTSVASRYRHAPYLAETDESSEMEIVHGRMKVLSQAEAWHLYEHRRRRWDKDPFLENGVFEAPEW